MNTRQKIKLTRADRVFDAVNTALLLVILVAVLYPLLYILASSFSSSSAVMAGRVQLWPVEPNLEAYRVVFTNKKIFSGFANTILYTVCGTLVGIVLTVMAAYPLSRHDFFGRGFFMGFVTFTMLFGGGLIPSYLINMKLGLVDNRLALILLGSLSAYNIMITRTFFSSNIPREMLEAAQIDGCDDFRFIARVVLPLSKTIVAILVLFYAVGHWNSYYNALIYIRSDGKNPLQVVLRNILILSQMYSEDMDVSVSAQIQGMQDLIKYALIVVASAPILLLYPLIQKHFVKGIMIGSLKG